MKAEKETIIRLEMSQDEVNALVALVTIVLDGERQIVDGFSDRGVESLSAFLDLEIN